MEDALHSIRSRNFQSKVLKKASVLQFLVHIIIMAGFWIVLTSLVAVALASSVAENHLSLARPPKHVRSYKSLHNGTKSSSSESDSSEKSITNSQKRSLASGGTASSPAGSRTFSNPHHPEDDGGYYGSSPIGLQKTPPDLQFGLAFTVPFVSLSTDKLINTFAGKSSHNGGGGYGDVSNILKLNLSGLVIAAVVGIAAFLFIPSLLGSKGGGGGYGGWGSSGGGILDSILPAGLLGGVLDHFGLGGHGGGGGHGDGGGWNPDSGISRPFGYQDYYEYNGVHNRKDPPGQKRSSRNSNTTRSSEVLGMLASSVKNYAKKYVSRAEGCIQSMVCQRALKKRASDNHTPTDKPDVVDKATEEEDLLGFIQSISNNELIKGSEISIAIQKAHQLGASQDCSSFKQFTDCGFLL